MQYPPSSKSRGAAAAVGAARDYAQPSSSSQQQQQYGNHGYGAALSLPAGAAQPVYPGSSSAAAAAATSNGPNERGRSSESWISVDTTHTHTGLLAFSQQAGVAKPLTPENAVDAYEADSQYARYGQQSQPPLESPELLVYKEQFMPSDGGSANGHAHGQQPNIGQKTTFSNSQQHPYPLEKSSGTLNYGKGLAYSSAGENVSSFLKGYATPHQLVFLVIVLCQTLATAVMIALTWGKIQAGTPSDFDALSTDDERALRRRSITVYLAIFLFGSVFEIITALDALRLNNTIQLIGVVLFVIAMMVYGALLDGQVKNALSTADGFTVDLYTKVRPFIVAIPIIQAAAAVLLAFYTYKLFKDFGWEILHLIGADRKLKRMYTHYLIHLCLLKFDFFFFVGFSMQYLILVLSVQEAEFVITILAFPVTIIFLILSAIAVRREIRWLSWPMFFVEVAALAYFVFKLFRLFQPSQAFRYQTSRKTLAVFSALAIVMLLCTVWTSVLCYRNYGQGLKSVIPNYWSSTHKGASRHKKAKARKDSVGAQGALDNRLQNRMSID